MIKAKRSLDEIAIKCGTISALKQNNIYVRTVVKHNVLYSVDDEQVSFIVKIGDVT